MNELHHIKQLVAAMAEMRMELLKIERKDPSVPLQPAERAALGYAYLCCRSRIEAVGRYFDAYSATLMKGDRVLLSAFSRALRSIFEGKL